MNDEQSVCSLTLAYATAFNDDAPKIEKSPFYYFYFAERQKKNIGMCMKNDNPLMKEGREVKILKVQVGNKIITI